MYSTMPSVYVYVCRSPQSADVLQSHAARLLPDVPWSNILQQPLGTTPFAQRADALTRLYLELCGR
jgi:hypothetical protein